MHGTAWRGFAVGESTTTLKVKVKDDENDDENEVVSRKCARIGEYSRDCVCAAAESETTSLSTSRGTFAAETSLV